MTTNPADIGTVDLDRIVIRHGSHDKQDAKDEGETKACIMEWAWILHARANGLDVRSGWTDSPACTCSVIAAILRTYNDRIGRGQEGDDRRTRVLRPLLPLIVGTSSTEEVRNRRIYMASDWGIRVALPKLLRVTSFGAIGDRLALLPQVVDEKTLGLARETLWAAHRELWAARDAAWVRLRNATAAAAAAAATDAAAAAAAATAAAAAARVAASDVRARSRVAEMPAALVTSAGLG